MTFDDQSFLAVHISRSRGGNVIELCWGSTSAFINGAPRRLGDYFFREPGTRHPNLDTPEHSSTVRAHCGFRVVTRQP